MRRGKEIGALFIWALASVGAFFVAPPPKTITRHLDRSGHTNNANGMLRVASTVPSSNLRLVPLYSSESDLDFDMAPVDLDYAMGSIMPQWNKTEGAPAARLEKDRGAPDPDSPLARYSLGSFPRLPGSDVYNNGTSQGWWWNQNRDVVSIYVPLEAVLEEGETFDKTMVEFKCTAGTVKLSVNGKKIIEGELHNKIDPYSSLWYVDIENFPPYIEVDLFKLRSFQNWGDLWVNDITAPLPQ